MTFGLRRAGWSSSCVLQLQVSAGWSRLRPGLSVACLVTVALMLLSSRAAALSARIGPRILMSLAHRAAGCLLLVPVGAGAGWLTVLPGMVVFALGLALLVSPSPRPCWPPRARPHPGSPAASTMWWHGPALCSPWQPCRRSSG